MGIFLRHMHLIKPERAQCGSDADVQASIFKNAERIGINPASVAFAMPMWGPGNQIDYAIGLTGINTTVAFINNSLQFGSGRLTLGRQNPIVGASEVTMAVVVKLNTLGTSRRFLIKWASGLDFILSTDDTNSDELIYGVGVGGGNYYLGWTTNANLQTNKQLVIICTVKMNGTENAIISVNGVNATMNHYREDAGTASSSNDVFYIGDNGAGSGSVDGLMASAYMLKQKLNASQIAFLSDNPYYLLQRVAPVFYSLPGGVPPSVNRRRRLLIGA
jgi:hypothetical protein